MTSSSVVIYGSLLFSLVLVCPFFVSGRFTTEHIDEFGKACNASEDDLVIAKSYRVPTSETGKCLMKCMMNKLGVLGNDGMYNKTGAKESLEMYWSECPLDKLDQINNRCHDEALKVSPDVVATCLYAYEVIDCINKQLKLFGIL